MAARPTAGPIARAQNEKRGIVAAAAALLVAAFLLQGLLSLWREAPTFDEVSYFGLGQYILYTGRFDVPGAGTHPPLSFYLASLPLLGRPLEQDLWRYPARLRQRYGPRFSLAHDAHRGQRLFARDQPPDRLLNRCRAASLAEGLVLGPAIFLWSRRLFGLGAGFLSLFLFAFDPNLIAHARLITPDFLLTVTFFASVFFASRQRGRSAWKEVAGAGLCAGLALLTKHSALLLALPLGAIFLAPGFGRSRGQRALEFTLVLLLAVFLLCLGYQFKPWHYLESLRLQLEHASSGHRAFLWGEVSDRGWWYYYLFAFALKTPLPLLVLLGWSAWAAAVRRLAPPRDLAVLVFPPFLVVGAFSFVRGPDIGLRYILPAYPFLIVLAGAAVPACRHRRAGQALLALLVAWQVTGTLRIFPHYLAFFNEIGGGPQNGFRYLVDSNLDWGQDLKALKRYLDEHRIESVRLSYFGAADPAMYGIRYEPLPGYFLGMDVPAPTEWRGVLAISATNLAGVYLRSPDTFAPLRSRTPDAQIGYSIFIYDLR